MRISSRNEDISVGEIAQRLAALLLYVWNLPPPDIVLSIGDIICSNPVRDVLQRIAENSRINAVFVHKSHVSLCLSMMSLINAVIYTSI